MGSTVKKTTVLEEAQNLIYGEREAEYGPPEVNINRIAHMWSGYLGFSIDAVDVLAMMTMLKMARLFDGERKRDSVRDMAGYVGLIERVVDLKE